MSRLMFRAALWTAGAGLIAASAAAPALAQTVKVGIINTYSGPEAQLGDQLDKGLKLYYNEHLKDLPPGVKIELVVRDDTGPNPEVAKRLAQELIVRERVQLMAGLIFSPNAAAIAPLTKEAKTPFVLMNAAGSAIPRISPYLVRTSFTLWQQAYPMGKWAAQHDIKTAYTAVSDYIPGHDGEAGFTKGFTEAGGKIVGNVRFPLANADFVPFLQRVKDAKPDAVFIFVPGGKQATAILKAASEIGLQKAGIKIVATQDVVPDEELPNIGDNAVGIITAGIYSTAAERPQNKAFLAAWRKAYGESLTASADFFSVGGWDGMAAIFDLVIKTKGTFTGDEAMEFFKTWKNPDSPRGPIAIDPETRDIVQNVYIRRTEKKDGKLVNTEVETIPAVKDPWKEFNPLK
jgi:branched-chain amino acid transport system substrate-binding protein